MGERTRGQLSRGKKKKGGTAIVKLQAKSIKRLSDGSSQSEPIREGKTQTGKPPST